MVLIYYISLIGDARALGLAVMWALYKWRSHSCRQHTGIERINSNHNPTQCISWSKRCEGKRYNVGGNLGVALTLLDIKLWECRLNIYFSSFFNLIFIKKNIYFTLFFRYLLFTFIFNQLKALNFMFSKQTNRPKSELIGFELHLASLTIMIFKCGFKVTVVANSKTFNHAPKNVYTLNWHKWGIIWLFLKYCEEKKFSYYSCTSLHK